MLVLFGLTRDVSRWYCQVPNGTLRAYAFLKAKVWVIISLGTTTSADDKTQIPLGRQWARHTCVGVAGRRTGAFGRNPADGSQGQDRASVFHEWRRCERTTAEFRRSIRQWLQDGLVWVDRQQPAGVGQVQGRSDLWAGSRRL